MSMFPNVSINGRIRSSGQLGRWWYSISPCRNNREATEARFDELRTEIRAAQESANSQMEELRGYIVQHLNQHSRDDE